MSDVRVDIQKFVKTLPAFKRAKPKPKPISQREKSRRVAGMILKHLYTKGHCGIDTLEEEAIADGLTGRVNVTLGKGIGGRDGLNIECHDGSVLLCRDNVINCIDRLGEERFAKWIDDNSVNLAEFGPWLDVLPAL